MVGDSGAVILNQTPFYAESGGQVGDIGVMSGQHGRFQVNDTQKMADDLIVHFGVVEAGTLQVGAKLTLEVDHARRTDIRRNHSATHLLHEALRQVLGDHVAQKGSLVAPDRLRFDFSHPKPMSNDEIERVEDIANDIVLQNAPVITRLLSRGDAITSGARALFGEKYGDEVRVVAMGEGGGNTLGWSVELCGGTHVRRTGDIGLISVVGESGVAAGVRRIEALTANAARANANNLARLAKATASELRVPIDEIPARIAALLDERKRFERELTEAQQKLALSGGGARNNQPDFVIVNGTKLMIIQVKDADPRNLKPLADQAKLKIGSGVVAVANTTSDGRASLVVGVTSDLTPRISAIDLVRKGAEALGGKGGGRPEMAQAGGPDGSKVDAALAAIEAALGG
jgi:alanyl-tRNA synthetase